jgi:DNA-binding CsgD family transcriptional regulator
MLLEYVDALEYLEDQLSEAAVSGGRLLIVNGGLTSGKTELLQEFAARAARTGALCLGATASRGQQSLGADVVDQLFHSGGLPPETIGRVSRLLTPEVTTAEPGSPDLESLRGDGARAVRDTCAELLQLSRQQPLVIGVDDIQFADAFSLQLLLYLRRRMESARILVVLSKWDWPQPTLPLFHAEITRHPHGWIRMVPLSENGIAGLIAQRTGRSAEPGLVSAYSELTGGNPMLVDALIEDQRGIQKPSSDHPAPGLPTVGNRYLQAVLACLYRWDPQLLDVARGLAVLGEQGSPALLSRLIGIGEESTEELLRTLTAEGLLTTGRSPGSHHFRHPAIPKALLNTLSTPERSRDHLRAAELLHHSGSAAQQIAWHLTEANGAVGDWSAGVLREAAEQALADDESRTAARFLELALHTSSQGAERDTVRMALARASWRISPSASGLHLTSLPEARRAQNLNRQDAVTLVRHALWQGDLETVTRGLAVLDESGGTAEDHAAACLQLTRRWFYGPAAAAGDGPARPAAHGREPGSGETDPWARAVAELATVPTHAGDTSATARARHVLENCELNDITLETVAAAVLTLAHGGETDAAAGWCDDMRQEATRREAVTWLAVLESVRAGISLRHGDLRAAAELAATAYGRLPASAWGVFIGYPLSILVAANTALDNHRVVAEYLRQIVPEAMFSTVWGAHYLRARGRYRLAADRVLSAVSDFRECGDLAERVGMDVPALCPWRSDLAEANLRLGRTVVAHGLLTDQLGRPAGLDARTHGASLRLLAASSDPGQRKGLLERAVSMLEDSDDRLELARALDDMSRLLHQHGEGDLARSMARRATQETLICRTGSGEPAGDEEPDAAPQAPRLPAGAPSQAEQLSEAERRVAMLAARGHTNREISGQLFITVSTVEQHLTRVYRKLGVSKRSNLSTRLPSWWTMVDG